MRDFYEPVYSYQSPAFQTQADSSKKSSSSSSGNVLGRFLKLGKSKSDANGLGLGLKSRSSRPSSYHSDDFEEDFRLTPSSKSPVERMVHKVSSKKDVSRSHSWIYGSVKLPSEFCYVNGPGGNSSGPHNSQTGVGAGASQQQHHGIPRCQKLDYCGTCDCTSDFDFLSPGSPNLSLRNGASNNNNNFPSSTMMNMEGGCPGCNPAYAMSECGKNARQYFDMSGGGGRNRKGGQGIVDSGKKFGSSVRKLTWKSLKQAVRKRPSLENVLKKSNSSAHQQQHLVPPPPSSMMGPFCNGTNGTKQEIPNCSHEDLLASNYFFPEKKSFYASCTDLYESPPYVASVRVRPKRSRQPWPLNEFGPVPNYQEEEIYHSEWDLRQFMPYDVWLTAANNPLLNPQHPPTNDITSTSRIPKINRPSNHLTATSSTLNNNNNVVSSHANNHYGTSTCSTSNNNNNNNNNVIKNKAMSSNGSSSAIYGQTIVKRSSILRTDVTAYQLIKSTRGPQSSTTSNCGSSRMNNESDEQSDSDDLSDNVLTEDPVRIGGQGIYMISSNPINSPNNSLVTMSNSQHEPNRTSTFTSTVPSSSSSSNMSSHNKYIKKTTSKMDGPGIGHGSWNESSLKQHQQQQQQQQVASKEMMAKQGGGGGEIESVRDRDRDQHQVASDKTNSNNNRLMDLHESQSSSSSTFNPINNSNSLKTYCSQPNGGLSMGIGNNNSNNNSINNNTAPGKKLNTGRVMMSDRSGTKYADNNSGTCSNNAMTSENNHHQDYLRHFDTYQCDDFDHSHNDSTVTDTKLRHQSQSQENSNSVQSNYNQNKNVENSSINDNKYFPSKQQQQQSHSSSSCPNSNSMSNNNSNETTILQNQNSNTVDSNKYGALKRRKGRAGVGAGANKPLLKEIIYEEESDEGGDSKRLNNQDIYAVKIVVSQNVASEYVKPILKKERVYETPCLDGKNHQLSSSTLHNNESNYNHYNSSGGGGEVCGDGSATRSTKKVQFDNSKLVVCGGLSEEDDGDESDDTLVKTDKDCDWIVEEDQDVTTSMTANLDSSSSHHHHHQLPSNNSTSTAENEFLMEDDSMKSCSKIYFTETKNISSHHHRHPHSTAGGSVNAGNSNSSGGVNNPAPTCASDFSKLKHGHGGDGVLNTNTNNYSSSNRLENSTGDKQSLKDTFPLKVENDNKTTIRNGDQMNQSHVDSNAGPTTNTGTGGNRIQEKIKVQPRKYETPHTHATSTSSSFSSTSLKADRIANMPERKTVKGCGPEQIINPNSLLFHDTTRIRLNQTRPSIEHTFKLNLSQPQHQQQQQNGGIGQSSKVGNEKSHGGSRGMNRIKQSSSFRTPVVAGNIINSKFQMRPREPPPPPPSKNNSKNITLGESSTLNSRSGSQQNQAKTGKVIETAGSNASSKLQKTLSNIAKMDRRQVNGDEQHKVVEGQCSSSSRGNKAEISLAMGSSITSTGATTTGKNGINMRNTDGGAGGTHNSTMKSNSSNNNNNKNAYGKTMSATVPTSNTKNSTCTPTTAARNNNSHRQVKVSSNRSKSLTERCLAVEKILAQHHITTSPQSHEDKQTKSNKLIKSISGAGSGDILASSKVLENNKMITENKKKNGTFRLGDENNENGIETEENLTNRQYNSESKGNNKNNNNNNSIESFLLSQQNNSNLHHKSNFTNANNVGSQECLSKNESLNSNLQQEKFTVTGGGGESIVMNSVNNDNQNNTPFQIRNNANTNDGNKSTKEMHCDGPTQNIEIVTKENSVSEIRIYSGTSNLNIDHNSESAKILNNYGRPSPRLSAPCNSSSSSQEMHYAATDIVCPSSMTSTTSSSNNNGNIYNNKLGVSNTTNNNSTVAHFRQTSAPSSLISSRPQSTSVVHINMDYSSSTQGQEGNEEKEQADHSLNGNSTTGRSLNETTDKKSPTSTTLTYEEKKDSCRPSHLQNSSTPSLAPSSSSLSSSSQTPKTRIDERTRMSVQQNENEDQRCLTDIAKTCSMEQEEEGIHLEKNSSIDNSSVQDQDEPLYDDVINHSTRQVSSSNDSQLRSPTTTSTGMMKKHSNFLSPLFHSLSKELVDRTTNVSSSMSNVSQSKHGNNKYPLIQPRPTIVSGEQVQENKQLPPLPCSLPPLLPPQNGSNGHNNNNNNYPSLKSCSPPSVNSTGDEELDSLYNDIEFNTVCSIPPPSSLKSPPQGLGFSSMHYKGNYKRNSMNRRTQDDSIIYDDTLSVISSNYSRSIINGKIHEEEDGQLEEDEPLYDDVLNVRSQQDSDSGTENTDSPPPLPQGPPPTHLKPCTDLPLLSFPLLLSNNNNNHMRKNCNDPIMMADTGLGSVQSTQDLLGDSKSFPLVSMNDGQNSSGSGGSTNNSTLVEGDDVLDRTRTLLSELNDRLAKLNFGTPTDYSTYVSKVVISSSSESSGVEEDYNSEKNYSLSNGSFDENYRLTAVSKLVSETISMARGKFLDSMKVNNNHHGHTSGGASLRHGSSTELVPSPSSGGVISASSTDNLDEPIYEEIGDLLQRSTSPIYADAFDAKSIFDGASKNEILSFLESIRDKLAAAETNSTDSAASSLNRSKKIVEIERNDSGIGSESGSLVAVSNTKSVTPSTGLRLCTDCSDAPVDPRLNATTTLTTGNTTTVNGGECTSGQVTRALNLCRCCIRKRSERKELLQEIYETELKYGRDLRIIEEEFYNPIHIAGLLTKEQLDQIFLNVGELIEVNLQLTGMLKSAIDTATSAQDEDLTTVNVGKIFLEFGEAMMTTFDAYCTRQASAGALLTQLEKEKELLRIFLRVSQMENSTLRRMNLPAFLMVPVQRAVRYPLLLARLLKVTPVDHFSREELYSAHEKIEQHLENMNKTAREVASVKLWRRISIMNGNIGNSSPVHRRSNSDLDGANIRIRKMALDVLDWANFSDVSCIIESQLNVVHFNGKTLRNIYGCLLARGKDLESLALKMEQNDLFFPPAEDIVKDVKLVLVRVKNTRFCLLREPFCLSKTVISQGENEFQDFIEINEIITKNTYYFQGMEKHGTMEWLRLLQCHAVCVGQWRRRRGALANIMMNGMIRHL